MNNLLACYVLRDLGFRPNHPAKFVMTGDDSREYEFISYPFASDDQSKVYIMVRVKDHPSTMRRCEIPTWAGDFA